MKFVKQEIASFDVDAQKCFTPLCPGELPVPEGHEIVDELNAQAEYAQYRIGSKDAHPMNAYWNATREKPQFTEIEGHRNLDLHWNMHGVIGTYGFELLDGLPHPQDYSYFVWKGMEPDMHPYGACFHDLDNKISTGVIEFLKENGVRVVIVGGLATDFCVRVTVLQLLNARIEVILNLGATRGIAEESTRKALDEVKLGGFGAQFVTSASEIPSLF